MPPAGSRRPSICDLRENKISRMYEPGDYIKAVFKDDETLESEWMWVRVETDDPAQRLVFGVLDSEPVVSTKLHLGMHVA